MMERMGFYIDSASCSGCKTCQVACQDRSDLRPGQLWRRVYEVEGGTWKSNGNAWEELPYSWFVSLSCNHCASPECVRACPTRAMHVTENGLVDINREICMGCGYCNWACPYDAPRMDQETGRMSKCDGCPERVAAGRKPACVAACPMRALDFGPLSDLRKRYGDTAVTWPLPDPSITDPSIVIREHHLAGRSSYNDARIVNREEVSDE